MKPNSHWYLRSFFFIQYSGQTCCFSLIVSSSFIIYKTISRFRDVQFIQEEQWKISRDLPEGPLSAILSVALDPPPHPPSPPQKKRQGKRERKKERKERKGKERKGKERKGKERKAETNMKVYLTNITDKSDIFTRHKRTLLWQWIYSQWKFQLVTLHQKKQFAIFFTGIGFYLASICCDLRLMVHLRQSCSSTFHLPKGTAIGAKRQMAISNIRKANKSSMSWCQWVSNFLQFNFG